MARKYYWAGLASGKLEKKKKKRRGQMSVKCRFCAKFFFQKDNADAHERDSYKEPGAPHYKCNGCPEPCLGPREWVRSVGLRPRRPRKDPEVPTFLTEGAKTWYRLYAKELICKDKVSWKEFKEALTSFYPAITIPFYANN